MSSIRTGQDPGYAISAAEKAKRAAFNATSPRFNYFKEEQLLAEVPGPGAYERLKSQEVEMREMSRSSSIEGGNVAINTRGNREDYQSYLPPPKISLGPGAYHQTGRPFLKKSFNASLPPVRFV